MKEIILKVDQNSFSPKNAPSSLQNYVPSNSFEFRLADLLLHIGIATAQPLNHEVTLNNYWAYLRYINCFEDGQNFKTTRELQEIDAHQKTILSDDLGMGSASMVITNLMGIDYWTPTSFFIKHLPSLASITTNKNGNLKSPDFVVLDRDLNLHIVECKGTQTSLSALGSQMMKGSIQKNSLNDPNNIIDEKLVSGIFVPQHSSTEQAQMRIIDPDFNLDFSVIKEKKELVFLTYQAQLAKELHLSGIHQLGNLVARKNLLKDDSFTVDFFLQELKKEISITQKTSKSIPFLNNVVFKNNFNESVLEESIGDSNDLLCDALNKIIYQNEDQPDKSTRPRYYSSNSTSTYEGIFGLELKLQII